MSGQARESVEDDVTKALDLVTQPYTRGKPLSLKGYDDRRFGELLAFNNAELDELESLRELILRYVAQRSPRRPLCLAVFGPPGSGKSYGVVQVHEEVKKNLAKSSEKAGKTPPAVPVTTINLTQVAHPIELGRLLARIAGEQDENTVPIIFFDEFDTSLRGTRFGWLGWFLAPMHDGEFFHEGAIIRLRRAILIFAGGTAATMQDFEHSSPANEFRAAKGPDFISRLRGFLNVEGPNSEPRALRRAIVLRSEIERRIKGFGEEMPASGSSPAPFEANKELMRSLLMAGRYRHGARSIAAVIELSDINRDANRFHWKNLPEDHLLALHIDRGELDSKRIHGSIALSGFQPSHDPSPSSEPTTDSLEDCWKAMARRLWNHGATLAYAGAWNSEEERPLLQLLVGQQKDRVCEPNREGESVKPRPWLKSYLAEPVDGTFRPSDDLLMPASRRDELGLEFVKSNWRVGEEEGTIDQRIIIERFRRRLAVAEASVARFAVGGIAAGHMGRMPGIAEELMLSMVRNCPVYLAGAFGGAVQEVGMLLGLSDVRTGAIPPSMETDADAEAILLTPIKEHLRPPPWTNLPVTKAETVAFFRKRAIGGNRWPDNGLDPSENRRLFVTKDVKEVVDLVLKGLLARFRPSM